ncbi:MAG: GspE/PulE family protein [Acidimicrobiales bacterium]
MTRNNRGSGADELDQLGPVLVQAGVISAEQLDRAEAEHQATQKPLSRVLVDSGVAREADLIGALASRIGFRYVDLGDYPIDSSAVLLVPDQMARRFEALPIGWEDGRLLVAMTDPTNVFAIDDIGSISGYEILPVLTGQSSLAAAIDRFYRLEGDAKSIGDQAASEFEEDVLLSNVREVVEEAPIVKLINLMITQAINDRASDIHLEPTERDLRVRCRIDGVLHETMRLQKSIQSGVISRLKIMADINIAERRVPQDGRVSANFAGHNVDLRVATLPTVFGEKVVMRILDKSNALLRLSELGFLPESMARYESSYSKPYGTVLVTGPTGSGKSTTLYATLNILNQDSKNVITVEDPVEYRMAGINQVQVNVKAGLTFAAALRSILRSDPDIVLVGEIRDKETATIAVEAALTGHLVLSTLHTNDATSTPTRLIEMGVEPFLVASALDCIVAQRLARRLCDRCKQAYAPSMSDLSGLGWADDVVDGGEEIFRPVGCATCSRTGYQGRFAIHEVLTVSEEIERMIVDREHSEDIKKMAIAQGMLTLRQTGLSHVRRGVTSVEEILRVVA